jgi:carboxypeptidase family protein
MFRSLVLAAALATAFSGTASAQTSSGTISGRVLDSQGQAIPGATITLTRQDTRETRTFTSDHAGEFVFTAIQPGTYDIAVDLQGFKRYEKTGLALSASDRLSAGDLTLEVGGVAESIEVRAEASPVQSVSSERSAVLDSNQVKNLMSRGRDVMALLTILPGVVEDSEGADALGVFNSPASVSGTRGMFNGMNIDGVSGNVRSGDHIDNPLNMDAVAEVKVLMSSYQAEYGKGAGAIINIVSKGGTREFRGAAYDYVRNDRFNANNFFRNRQGLPRGDYRYNTFGTNLGGPIFVPGTFNPGRTKLFFFFSQEALHNVQPNGPRNYTVPTGLERQGNFSQSIDVSSLRPIVIRDPLTGQPFPGNVIPAGRIDSNMQKLLNVFPLPNVTPDANHHYNLQLSDTLDRPVQQELLRVDYNVSSKVRTWIRGWHQSVHDSGLASTTNNFTWGIGPMDYHTGGPSVGGNLTWIVSPTVVNEVTFGYSTWDEDQIIDPDVLAKIQRTNLGITLGQLYPANNPLGVIPAMSFSGITSAATVSYNARFPLFDEANSVSFSESLTKVWRSHQLKAGVQAERAVYYQYHTGSGNFAGSFNFGTTTSNPGDTGNAYANALVGNFQTYTEASARANYAPLTRILEWYAQDGWKARPRLTLDLGVRFTAGLPQLPIGHYASTFVPSQYDPTKAPVLYRPGFDPKGNRVAIDPTCPTCAPRPAALIGFVVPGTGDPLNGIVVSGTPGYPEGLVDYAGILAAPRLGFAWDMRGDQETVLRGGVGENFNPRNGSGILGDATGNPPQLYNPQQFNGSTATFLEVGNFQGISNINQSLNRSNPPPRVYNTSLGVQREIGFNTMIDVAYVGSFGRHIGQKRDINQVPYGARFLPQNQDPTRPGTPLPDNFFRPYPGYGSIPFLSFDGTSRYNSLQTQVVHRFSHGMEFGGAYTWSRALAYTADDQGTVAANNSPEVWNYGLADYDRTHVATLHYSVLLPPASHLVNRAIVKSLFDDWQFNGTMKIYSGAPLFWAQTTKAGTSNSSLGNNQLTPSIDLTGGGDGWRPVVVGDPELPASDRTVDHWFNTAAFARPAAGDHGNAGPVVVRGPGINNWNMSLFKNVRIGKRGRAQIRAEAYNVFNHTQFSIVDTTPQFDAQGNQVSGTFGQATVARDPRIMQFALRVEF